MFGKIEDYKDCRFGTTMFFQQNGGRYVLLMLEQEVANSEARHAIHAYDMKVYAAASNRSGSCVSSDGLPEILEYAAGAIRSLSGEPTQNDYVTFSFISFLKIYEIRIISQNSYDELERYWRDDAERLRKNMIAAMQTAENTRRNNRPELSEIESPDEEEIRHNRERSLDGMENESWYIARSGGDTPVIKDYLTPTDRAAFDHDMDKLTTEAMVSEMADSGSDAPVNYLPSNFEKMLDALREGKIAAIEYGEPQHIGGLFSALRITYILTAGGRQFKIAQLHNRMEGSGEYFPMVTAEFYAAIQRRLDRYHRKNDTRTLPNQTDTTAADLSFFPINYDQFQQGASQW